MQKYGLEPLSSLSTGVLQEDKGATEDEMVGWHHRLSGHEFEQTLGDREAWHATIHSITKTWT